MTLTQANPLDKLHIDPSSRLAITHLCVEPNKHYSGHRSATEIDGDQRTRGKEIWRKKCGQQVSDTTRGR